ncbi:MAG: ubiquitin-like protein UBact [bacterium]|nr:ubiquitin-like protein UBact [bacterium]
MTERMRRPTKPVDEEDSREPEGPSRPKVNRPDVGRVLRRMNQVPRDKARRYANPKNVGQ